MMADELKLTDQERCELVARQIEALLREHRLAGAYMVVAPEHAVHSLQLKTAPWLRLSLELTDDGGVEGIRIRSKLAEYLADNPTLTTDEARALQKRELEYTISALDFFGKQGAPMVMLSLEALQMLTKHFNSQTWGDRVGDATGKKMQ